LRRRMHYGQVLQSHALHFFHLSSPDLLFGFDAPAQQRNIIAVAAAHPDIATHGILLRKFGQEVIRITAGKRGEPVAYLASVRSTALYPATPDILKREDLQTPHTLLMAYLDGGDTVYALVVEDLR